MIDGLGLLGRATVVAREGEGLPPREKLPRALLLLLTLMLLFATAPPMKLLLSLLLMDSEPAAAILFPGDIDL